MPTHDAERTALLVRIDELLVNPSLAHIIDHYVERLIALGRSD